MRLTSIRTAIKWQGKCTAADGELEMGSWPQAWEMGLALVASWRSSSSAHRTLLRGRGGDLTFLTALQVSEYVRIGTDRHDMYMTGRSGCWLSDERNGNRGCRGG